jgi:hypothetical protein
MKFPTPFAIACALLCTTPAFAADKRVLRIDSLLASEKHGTITVEAKGAVATGGWSRPRLHVLHYDGRTVTMEFIANPPPPEMTVIEGLVPVTASAQIKGRTASVRVMAEQNEITSQVLR